MVYAPWRQSITGLPPKHGNAAHLMAQRELAI
jgi:hypothetical protein